MFNLFDRIRAKTQQVVQGVGNFIDRDKSMGGVQLAQGGLGNRISQAVSNVANRPVNVPQPVQNVLQRTNRINGLNLNPIVGASRNLANDPNYRSLVDRPQTVEADPFTNFMANRIGRPFLEIPDRINEAADPNRGLLDRTLSGMQAVGGIIPGLDDFFVAGAEGLKEMAAGQDPNRVLKADYQPTPLGDVLRNNQGSDTLEANLLDVAELPLMIGGMILTGKGGDDLLRRADDIPLRKLDDFLEQTGQAHLPKYIDELNTEIKELNTSIRNHDLIAKVDPKLPSVAELQSILKQKVKELKQATKELTRAESAFKADPKPTMIASDKGVIPLRRPLETQGDVRQIDEFLASQPAPQSTLDEILQLSAPKETLGLPAPQRSVTIAQLRKLAKQGDNLEGVEFVAKNADEAREAIKLGLPGNQIKLRDKTKNAIDTLFVTKQGDVLKDLPQNQQAYDFADEASQQVLNTGNKVTRILRKIFLDAEDNLKRTFGDSYKHLEPVMESFKTRINDGVRWARGYENKLVELTRTVKPGSADDKLLRTFGKKNGTQKVIDQVGPERAAELRAVYDSLRSMYDEILEFVNAARKSAGLNEIPAKEDFLSQIGGQRSMFDFFTEGSPRTADEVSSAIFKKQKGEATTGAIESMRDYLEYAQRAGFTDISGWEIRQFAESLSNQKGANREAVNQLMTLSKNILGDKKINPVLKGIENATGKLASAKVVGKASTLASQFLSLPQAIGRDPIAFATGNFNASSFKRLRQKSKVLDVVSKTTPRQLRTGNAWTKAVGISGDVLVKGQDVANRLLFNGFLDRARRMGLDDNQAVKWADEQLVKIVGDRRLGMSPEVYSTFIGKVFGKFTLEPTAATTRLIKDIGERKFGGILGTLVAWHIGNNINEKYGTGHRPFPDPYNTFRLSSEYWQGSDEKEQDKIKAVGVLVSEALKTMPLINNVFNTAYSVGELTGMLPDSEDVFGTEDNTWMNVGSLYNPLYRWDRNITGNRAVDVPWNILSNTRPFFEQGARSIQAGLTQKRGYAVTKDGSPMYKAPEGLDAIRSILFGQGSSQNAREFFDNDFKGWLSDNQKKAFDRLDSKDQKLDFLEQTQSRNEKRNKLKSTTRSIESFFGGDSDDKTMDTSGLFVKPTSQAEKDENEAILKELFASKQNVSPEDLSLVLFDNKVATSKSLEERGEVYKALKKAMDNEFLTDEQKRAILAASGASAEDYQYYSDASKDIDVKLQEIIPKLDRMSDEDMLAYLASGRKEIADKQMVTSEMITYLYDRGYISKEQREFLNAIKYDQINDEFYASRGYAKDGSGGSGGSGGKRLTVKQAAALFKVKMGKLPTQPPSIPLSSTSSSSDSSSRLIDEILFSGKTKPNKNSSLWFE